MIEAMIAVAIIFVGFAAIISIGLNAASTVNSSKTKLKVTAQAQGILEKFRAKRDAEGCANLPTLRSELLTPTIMIDGVKITPVITIYYPSTNSCLVETTLTWQAKKLETLRSYKYFTNLNNAAHGQPTFIPPWQLPTNTPAPTATSTPVLTATPTPVSPPWYLGSTNGLTCAQVCAANGGKVCVTGSWNDNSSCTILKALTTCNSCSAVIAATAPQLDAGLHWCQFRDASVVNQDCNGTQGYFRLCKCAVPTVTPTATNTPIITNTPTPTNTPIPAPVVIMNERSGQTCDAKCTTELGKTCISIGIDASGTDGHVKFYDSINCIDTTGGCYSQMNNPPNSHYCSYYYTNWTRCRCQ